MRYMLRVVVALFAVIGFVSSIQQVRGQGAPTFEGRTFTHIGMVVPDLEKTVKSLSEIWGVEAPRIMAVPQVAYPPNATGDRKASVKVAQLQLDNLRIELLEPTGGPSRTRHGSTSTAQESITSHLRSMTFPRASVCWRARAAPGSWAMPPARSVTSTCRTWASSSNWAGRQCPRSRSTREVRAPRSSGGGGAHDQIGRARVAQDAVALGQARPCALALGIAVLAAITGATMIVKARGGAVPDFRFCSSRPRPALPLTSMKRLSPVLWAVVAVCGIATPLLAHPAPFSFVDVRIQGTSLDIEVVIHAFDVAYELGVNQPDRVFDPAVLGPGTERLIALLRDRLRITADGRPLTFDGWSAAEPLPERQSVRLRAHSDLSRAPGVIAVSAELFPYDAAHQTFLNFYDDGALTSQAILGGDQTRDEYFVGSRQGTFAVIQKFVPEGVHHILIGPDHLLFLVGLLLLGGPVRRLLLVITGFTVAHSITLALAVLNLVTPPGGLVEPIIALSIVYVGADNLLVKGGRDMRVWIALVFGLIHGFGFASVLREMGLPTGALGWSLFSFNLGVEIGQVAVAAVVATVLMALRSHSDVAGRRLAFAGSIVVMAAGTFWFVQRVFFSGGIA